MSAQLTSALPTDAPTGTDDDAAAAPDGQHHPLAEPDEHQCSCGRLREECVRDTVRSLWSS
ncbi:hypothetical protein F4553_003142 [Allocatelliglobosispora scoriae]|uniref:Uncharacterized protein n=1 Tax=Allocatelliglobosispora scoriae TaxID=643052 RepID=A0A841BS74_9ACTN|nr:hypothetical protein [Allocatelliglobosispora scoriae]MBB5869763.1 hypothetical protein [Allocatelliglobosispora scoriae]